MLSIVELYALIIGKGGVSPAYFLDRMTWYEVDACLRGIGYRERAGWEQVRMLGYITAQSHSTKVIKYSDVMRFDWDKEKECIPQVDFDKVNDLKDRMKTRVEELNN